MDGLVHSDNSEFLHLLQQEVGHGQGGVHARVKHALQQSLVNAVWSCCSFTEGPLEVPCGLRGVEGKRLVWGVSPIWMALWLAQWPDVEQPGGQPWSGC